MSYILVFMLGGFCGALLMAVVIGGKEWKSKVY